MGKKVANIEKIENNDSVCTYENVSTIEWE